MTQKSGTPHRLKHGHADRIAAYFGLQAEWESAQTVCSRLGATAQLPRATGFFAQVWRASSWRE